MRVTREKLHRGPRASRGPLPVFWRVAKGGPGGEPSAAGSALCFIGIPRALPSQGRALCFGRVQRGPLGAMAVGTPAGAGRLRRLLGPTGAPLQLRRRSFGGRGRAGGGISAPQAAVRSPPCRCCRCRWCSPSPPCGTCPSAPFSGPSFCGVEAVWGVGKGGLTPSRFQAWWPDTSRLARFSRGPCGTQGSGPVLLPANPPHGDQK